MVFEFKYRIEFTGVHIKDAAKAIARYFNADVVSEKDIYKITDNMDRQWTFGHSEYVRAEGCSEEEEFYYQNVLETPMMYFPRDDDWFTIHDIFNVLRCIGGVTNDTCAMHIRTPFNFDHSMMGLMLSFYMMIQYDNFDVFDITSKSIRDRAKPYVLYNSGFGFDSYNELLDYIDSTYTDLYSPCYSAVENFALNFLSYSVDGTIEFRAFNASFDESYAAKASAFVRGFIIQCMKFYESGWSQAYDLIRSSVVYSGERPIGFLIKK